MSRVLVLADVGGAAVLRGWLVARAQVIDEVARSHSELACLRVRADDGTEIAVLEEHVADVVYVTLDGDPPTVGEWVDAIREQVETADVNAVLAMLVGEPRAWIRGLSRLAILRDGGEAIDESMRDAMFDAWERGLAHPERAVRRAAIRTCHGARWPEFAMLVRARIGVDHELRRALAQLMVHLDSLAQ